MMEKIMRFLEALFGWDRELPKPPQAPPVVVDPPKPPTPPMTQKPAPKPVQPPKKSNRELLYDAAKASIGTDTSPKDLAPDTLGCAESLNGVFVKAFGKPILKDVVGTYALWQQLRKDPRFVAIQFKELKPGDIVINPTGTSTKGAKNGHTGIWGNNSVMSNNSYTGLWAAHYTHQGWTAYFQEKLGFPTYCYRVK
jgi:hypothetical protein